MRPGQVHRAASRVLRPFGSALEAMSNFALPNGAAGGFEPHILFIVGAPRSGTTLLFQMITHALNFVYPNHLASVFPNAPTFGLWLGSLLSQQRPHHSFQSVHGYSTGDGLRGPNEWEAFLRRSIFASMDDPGCLSTAIEALRRVACTSEYRTKGPLCLKSLNAVLHIPTLANTLPNARFLAIDRDEALVARSILKAKRRERKPPNVLWYIAPPELRGTTFGCEEEQISAQMVAIADRIDRAERMLGAARLMRTNYTTICDDPGSIVAAVMNWLDWDLRYRVGANLPNRFEQRGL